MNQEPHPSGDPLELATVFRRAARQLAERGRRARHDCVVVPYLVVKAAGERFGVELKHVERVFPRIGLTPVPGAPQALVGVANLNGLPRSVFDLGRLLNLRISDSAARYVVLLRARNRRMGIAVEAVDEVQQCDLDKLMAVGETGGESARGMTKGITDEHVALLDAEALFGNALDNLANHASAGEPIPARSPDDKV